ncbi:hypothetical protein GF339_06590 [candidate division KSB3 bacterium]|uniref:B12-binding domain-containing protein n=1 Tax=candidate division KSB3 bacterium TaxID=2044937 RepID=A0A9D5JU20_9BACT|nr:hypothetical protein [candidate division KSB3 bacterium]MBD3324234.1 hypothetical protein [candidate division KSB3 bacterium]
MVLPSPWMADGSGGRGKSGFIRKGSSMTFARFRQNVHKILAVDLPPGKAIVREGRSLAGDIQIGRTAFLDAMGVDSEAEYKRQCIRDQQIMFHAHIGMNSWHATADALRCLYQAAEQGGFRIDRAGMCLDRRMGLPLEYRKHVPAETGPTLETPDAWNEVGRIVPIQPHMGDFMIGFPASTDNTLNALRAGVTTIGNLSQYFAHEVPMWRDHTTTTVETVRALALMGALRERGTLIHSYLEDGFGALFYDCATVAGWAYLERYIVEQLLDGKISHCIGGLTSDPVKRAGWIFVLDAIHDHDCLGSMLYGDTISFTHDFALNRGLVAEYLLWDIMAQLACPTGHAVLPLPVTEAVRVPSAEEIAEAHSFGRRIEQAARKLWPHVDFSASREFSETIASSGKTVCTNALEGLKEAGVDIHDPVQLLYVLKQLGSETFEEMFGAGTPDETAARGRIPVVPTDIFQMSLQHIDYYRPRMLRPDILAKLQGRRMLIASTDVHAHGILVIDQVLSEAGIEMINLGAERNPDEVVAAACAREVEAILISTHNGMALEYARRLQEELRRQNVRIPIIMGGVLNQKVDDQALPVDVTQTLKELGIHVSSQLEGSLPHMLGCGMPEAEEDQELA